MRKDFRFVSQIRDAARGGPRNIVEGFSRFNPTEILHFLSYAKASLEETRNHAIDGKECEYFSDQEADQLVVLIRRAVGAIRRWMAYLQSPAARDFYRKHVAEQREKGFKSHGRPPTLRDR